MKFKDRLDGEIAIFELSRKLMTHEDSITRFHGQVHQYVNLHKNKVVIDLHKIELMGSVGLGMLIAALTTVGNSGGRLVLANITKIQNLMAMTRLNLIFESFDSLEEAIAALKSE